MRRTFKDNRKKRRGLWLKIVIVIVCVCILLAAGFSFATKVNLNPKHEVGDIVDSLDGVAVYFNGGVSNSVGRNLAPDGYNLGIKYQCVEFVKRYYYEHYNHKMPDVWGHAISFFDTELPHNTLNVKRGLMQYHNGGDVRPQKGDLVVYSSTVFNRYGHVAIVAEVGDDTVTIIQQNPGPLAPSRETYGLTETQGRFTVENQRILGWLRLP